MENQKLQVPEIEKTLDQCEIEQAQALEAKGREVAIQTTFQAMGFRCKESIAWHLVLENGYNNNLVADISTVDYLQNHQGTMELEPLEGLPTFVDDIFVYGYIHPSHMVRRGNKISYTTGDNGGAKIAVSRICNIARDAFDAVLHVRIANTMEYRKGVSPNTDRSSLSILSNIASIEETTNLAALRQWKKTNKTDPEGVFVAKIHTAELPIEKLQECLPYFCRALEAIGFGLYSVDYTQDFAGTMDRSSLVEHLCNEKNYRKQGENASISDADGTILDNTNSVGNHVCTLVSKYTVPSTLHTYTTRTKFYNKVVSNMEAGDVSKKHVAHLSELVDCPDKHLGKTFAHPLVRENGCTRIETTVYGCREMDFSNNVAETQIQRALELAEDSDAFVRQPISMQYAMLAKRLDRCFLVCDRAIGRMYMAWYVHTKTKHIAGVQIPLAPHICASDVVWERVALQIAGDFGFRACPIYRVDILSADTENVSISHLQCYAKEKNAKTILAPCTRPYRLPKDVEDPSLLLRPTQYVHWEWRTKGVCKTTSNPLYPLLSIPTTASVEFLSLDDRQKRLQELAENMFSESWKQNVAPIHDAYEKSRKQRMESVQEFQKQAQTIVVHKNYKQDTLDAAKALLQYPYKLSGDRVRKLWEIPEAYGRTRVRLLAFCKEKTQKFHTLGIRVLLECIEGEKNGYSGEDPPKGKYFVVWATKQMHRLLEQTIDSFYSTPFARRHIYWIGIPKTSIELSICEGSRTKIGEKEISWNNLDIHRIPHPERLQTIQESLAQMEEEIPIEIDVEEAANPIWMQNVEPPEPKCTLHTRDMLEGDYTCDKYAIQMYRNKPRTVLFLQHAEPTAPRKETPVVGVFLAEEISKIDLPSTLRPILCHIGKNKTTKTKKKDRIFLLSISNPEVV